MQRIRPALRELQKGLGIHHALASRKLYTDGAELLYDYSERHPDAEAAQAARELVVIRSGQCLFAKVIEEYLRGFSYAPDGYVELFRVPVYREAEVVVDPMRSSGAPIFARGGCRVEDVLQRFQAGESLSELTAEFGVPTSHLEDALRVASRRAA